MRTFDLSNFGLPDGYSIREDGAVISTRSGSSFQLSMHIAKSGYPAVGLKVGRKTRVWLIHRLLALAFIPNPESKPQVNHIDGVKTNFALSNLEWATDAENKLHAYRIGLVKADTPLRQLVSQKASAAARSSTRALSDDQVTDIRRRLAAKETQTAIVLATGIKRHVIASIACGRTYRKSSAELQAVIQRCDALAMELAA